jgi:hypothetical protein
MKDLDFDFHALQDTLLGEARNAIASSGRCPTTLYMVTLKERCEEFLRAVDPPIPDLEHQGLLILSFPVDLSSRQIIDFILSTPVSRPYREILEEVRASLPQSERTTEDVLVDAYLRRLGIQRTQLQPMLVMRALRQTQPVGYVFLTEATMVKKDSTTTRCIQAYLDTEHEGDRSLVQPFYSDGPGSDHVEFGEVCVVPPGCTGGGLVGLLAETRQSAPPPTKQPTPVYLN